MASPNRILAEPPYIAPPPSGSPGNKTPLWSVMIPVYNCSKYLPETLESVLRQDQGSEKMQIEVCDDASTDADIEQLVYQIGKGRISYFRQKTNVGSLRNFETCLNRSKGHLIHLLHGDDKVRIGFYEKIGNLFIEYPEIGAAFCRYVSIDSFNKEEIISDLEKTEPGILDNWLERLAYKQLIQAPAIVVKRQVYENLGGFYGVHYGEDWEMWMRIAANYETGYMPEILAEYRKHDNSISGQYILTGQNIRDLKKVMQIAKSYFPKDKWNRINKGTRKFYANYAINTARKIWGRYQHKEGTKNQIREAFDLSSNPEIIYQAAKLYFKMLAGIKK
jgi:glycosyltransferase involved in cell wall biosynthesis